MHLKNLSPLVVCAFLLIPGTAAADDYHVKPGTHEPEAPGHYGPGYDCAGEAGPDGAVESAEYNVDALTDGERWGLPYLDPRCLAVDGRVGAADAPADPSKGGGAVFCADTPLAWRVDCRWTARATRTDSMGAVGRTPRVSAPEDTPFGAHARATYDLSTGRYYVGADAMTPLGRAAPLMLGIELMGNTGISVLFNCRNCSPPW